MGTLCWIYYKQCPLMRFMMEPWVPQFKWNGYVILPSFIWLKALLGKLQENISYKHHRTVSPSRKVVVKTKDKLKILTMSPGLIPMYHSSSMNWRLPTFKFCTAIPTTLNISPPPGNTPLGYVISSSLSYHYSFHYIPVLLPLCCFWRILCLWSPLVSCLSNGF